MKERSQAHREAMSRANSKAPIYELPHGIKIIGERFSGQYVRCTIAAHALFPNTKISKQNRQLVQRSRVVMTSALGRVLATNEHVHRVKEDEKHNDSLDNLEVIWSDAHNQHHKLGFKHTEETKQRISKGIIISLQRRTTHPHSSNNVHRNTSYKRITKEN